MIEMQNIMVSGGTFEFTVERIANFALVSTKTQHILKFPCEKWFGSKLIKSASTVTCRRIDLMDFWNMDMKSWIIGIVFVHFVGKIAGQIDIFKH